MTRTINTLAALGLIERAPHPSDGRQVVVSVSRSGRFLLTDKVSARDAWLAGHLSKLSDEQTTVLKQALDIMCHFGEAEPRPE